MPVRARSSPGKKQAQFEATRATLLRVARKAFARDGYADTGTNDIVRAAGVTRGALYYQFADKQALFRAVVEAAQADILAMIEAAAARAGSAWDAVAAGCRAFLEAASRPDIRQIVLIDGPAVLGWQAWREIDAAYGMGSLRVGVEAAQREGSLRADLSAEALTYLISGALNEAAMAIAEADDPDAVKAATLAGIDALLSGVRAR